MKIQNYKGYNIIGKAPKVIAVGRNFLSIAEAKIAIDKIVLKMYGTLNPTTKTQKDGNI